jgi:hypothetical protein
MRPRKSDVFFMVTGALLLALMFLPLHAAISQGASAGLALERGALVRGLGLTDLCLFTEARYTRHPSLADLSSAFQDHPSSLEHFPSGSLIAPPEHLKRKK